MWWTDNYAIGVKEIDEQHQELFELLTKLQEAIPKKNAAEEVLEVLTTLAIYTKVHFTTEEKLMDKIGYPYLEKQKRLHAVFVGKVQGLLMKIKKGETPSARATFAFLKTWLIEHIEKEDGKIREFIKARQKAAKTQSV